MMRGCCTDAAVPFLKFMKTKRITLISVMAAAALIIFIIEAQFPLPFPIPGIKLGLANIITLTSIVWLGKKDAFAVLLLRIVLGSIFTGNTVTLVYSAVGGLTAYLAMLAAIAVLKNIIAASIVGALGHNIGQIIAAAVMSHTVQIIYYLPILIISGVLTGLFTGIVAAAVLRRLM